MEIKELAKDRINEQMMLDCPYCGKTFLNKVKEGKYNELFTVCSHCWEMIYFDNYNEKNTYKIEMPQD